jgi:hypothetical protein
MLSVVAAAYAAEPRPTPAEYPVHADSADATIAADYMVHSVPTEEGMVFARHYLVVDIGVFPHKGSAATIADTNFRLIVNGRSVGNPDSPGMVAAGIEYPDWEWNRRLEGIAQAGPVVVAPQQPARFPGDPTATHPLPQPQPDDTGAPRAEHLSIDDLIAHARLPEGAFRKPVGGALCFHYEGKPKKIRTLELVWEPPAGQPVTLTLK